MALLSVSLFAADIMQLREEISSIKGSGADRLHVDIMDGHFVPLLGYNNIWIKSVLEEVKMPAEFHFMAYLTEDILGRYLLLGPKEAVIHVEALEFEKNLHLLRQAKEAGVCCGVAISPETPLKQLVPYLPHIDTLLMMSRRPGEENSVFTEDVYGRIREACGLIRREKRKIKISVDGGLDAGLAAECIKNGAEEVIIGRAFYKEKDKLRLVENIHHMYI